MCGIVVYMLIKFIILIIAVFWMLSVMAGFAFGTGQIVIGLILSIICITSVVSIVRVYHSADQ